MNKQTLLDVLTAIAIGLLLAIGALAYFDVLVK
jgi:type II secretory pathway component PulJ